MSFSFYICQSSKVEDPELILPETFIAVYMKGNDSVKKWNDMNAGYLPKGIVYYSRLENDCLRLHNPIDWMTNNVTLDYINYYLNICLPLNFNPYDVINDNIKGWNLRFNVNIG